MNKINIQYGIEEIISRVPGLFPYIEFNGDGTSSVHPASDSINGCYGKIPCSIILPLGINLTYDGETILSEGNEYTYNTLMQCYYKYDNLYTDNVFIEFMKRGIGIFKIDADIDYEICVLVPEYAYYSECDRLYDEYEKISILCNKYNEIKLNTGEVNCDLECLIEKYAKMGGDVMRDYYKEKSAYKNIIAEEFLGYAGTNFNLNFNVNIVSKTNDLGLVSSCLNYWNSVDTYNEGDVVIYNDRSYVCKYDNVSGDWDDSNFKLISEEYEVDDDNLTGVSNSQLSNFRGVETFISEGGTIEIPNLNEDWLWYYKIGKVGHYETTTDSDGNIYVEGNRVTIIDEYETNLHAYGDIITNITRSTDDNTITFEYIIGCNLKAKYKGSNTDDDGIVHYYYGDYEYNENDSHGVVFTETYYYEDDGDIYNMSDSEFSTYITYNRGISDKYKKCAFSTTDMTYGNDLYTSGGQMKGYVYRPSNISTKITTTKDSIVAPIMRVDYLVGTSYTPTVKSDVYINRGYTAAWERHIKLGEIKTFDDLVNYSNGGFFNLM